jgi:hypothetical protein
MSKILKQNGANGKIMRAQTSGKVLKQNYNFDRALFTDEAGFGISVKLPPVVSYVFFFKYIHGVYTPSLFDFVRLDANTRFYKANNYGTFLFKKNGTIINQYAALLADGFNVLNVILDENGLKVKKVGPNGYYEHIASDTLPVSTDYTYATGGNTNPSTSEQMVSFVAGFNRELSEVELRYLYSNGNGNSLLNINGLAFIHNNNKTEVLDSNVAIPDDYGNTPGIVQGLPAGTLQEQSDWANINLFKRW